MVKETRCANPASLIWPTDRYNVFRLRNSARHTSPGVGNLSVEEVERPQLGQSCEVYKSRVLRILLPAMVRSVAQATADPWNPVSCDNVKTTALVLR